MTCSVDCNPRRATILLMMMVMTIMITTLIIIMAQCTFKVTAQRNEQGLETSNTQTGGKN